MADTCADNGVAHAHAIAGVKVADVISPNAARDRHAQILLCTAVDAIVDIHGIALSHGRAQGIAIERGDAAQIAIACCSTG